VNILITGSEGFIAKNLKIRLLEKHHSVLEFKKGMKFNDFVPNLHSIDLVFHLAGENRPEDINDFKKNNEDLTNDLANLLQNSKKNIPVFFSSSTQVSEQNPYSNSKKNAEIILKKLYEKNGNLINIYRLPNIFGKWSKPNYNSAVATFCYNISRKLEIDVHDPNKPLSLLYIDDLIDIFENDLEDLNSGFNVKETKKYFKTTVGKVADLISSFETYESVEPISEVGEGLERALYSTYLSFLPKDKVSFKLTVNEDQRGKFVEVLKTKKSGQFSFLTAHPGQVRGQHYHHSKNEKFLVLSGNAEFNFKNLISNETFKIKTSERDPMIVRTIPGWIHNIKNIGKKELIVMLWANELFDPENPDTIAADI
tara:strand:+ start:5854 stop:6957 length:1104 start_codon:yes stop_codon:yes gene_type:complete